jgi:hypothetical protein
MKKFAPMAANTWLSYLSASLRLVVSTVFIVATFEYVYAADFSCPSIMSAGSAMPIGDVTCLIDKINDANGMPGVHTINLGPGIYTLQAVDNGDIFNENGLPVITSSIRIQASADDPPTVIERDPNAPAFRIFEVSVGGELSLEGVTVQRGGSGLEEGGAIFNRGVTSLRDSTITDSMGDFGAISNIGTLNVFRSIIADNGAQHAAGGILNDTGGKVLIENSTIARNLSDGAGGILNLGSLVVRNSAIIFNRNSQTQEGGGIVNFGGFVEIVNSTIANNVATSDGGGVWNGGSGVVSITNSTIRENRVPSFASGGGIANDVGTVRIQNTIIAGNTGGGPPPFPLGPDCSGTIISLGNNLIGDPTGCTIAPSASATRSIDLQWTDLTGDPGLGSFVGVGEDDLPGRAYYPVLEGSAVIDKGNPNACLQTDQLGNLRADVCDIGAVEFRGPMLVSVDIRPKKDANRINPNSGKDINVAIFSVNGFDATTVDSNTVRFGKTGIEAAPINVALKDIDGDGNRDMVLRFAIQDTGIACGDTSAVLTAQTSNGLSITGSSPIKTVQCKNPKVSRN